MTYIVREQFHHPDVARDIFYKVGDKIHPADEYNLKESGHLDKHCTRVEEEPSQSTSTIPVVTSSENE